MFLPMSVKFKKSLLLYKKSAVVLVVMCIMPNAELMLESASSLCNVSMCITALSDTKAVIWSSYNTT